MVWELFHNRPTQSESGPGSKPVLWPSARMSPSARCGHAAALARTAMCQEATYAPQQTALLFDHLVGAGEERRGHFEAERLGGFKIDYKLEFGWLQHRQVGRLLALKMRPA